ncbi:MAG TPA: hypothetical protein VGE92_10060 [Steroidobacteraceae bacterium]
MATPADQRLLDLLEKWLKSLELHLKYSTLDDDSYWKTQTWVKHQRPSRWIIDLAMQKTRALRAQVEERMAAGDEKYSDSLELMSFLANLVGVEHIERFIPLAGAENEHSLAPEPTPQPSAEEPPGHGVPAADASTGTREMPRFSAVKRGPPPAGTAQVARSERKAPAPAKSAAKKPAAPLKPQPRAVAALSDAAREQVMADAARLVQWGRKWYELPELIARMAGRPSLPDVRRILKENKAAIDRLAGNA